MVSVNDGRSPLSPGDTQAKYGPSQLSGGLRIYFDKNGTHEDVTDATSSVVVGQPIRLEARFGNGSLPDLSGKGWTGMTKRTAVRSYTFENVQGSTTFLHQKDLTDPDITFYWVEGSTTPGTAYRIGVTGKDRRTGVTETAETTFDVVAPLVYRFNATTCGFGINRTFKGPGFSPPEMILGYNDTSPGCRVTPGIQWSIDVVAPPTTAGNVGMTQTVTSTIRHDKRSCVFGGVKLDGTRTLADNGTLVYGSQTLAAHQHWTPDPQLEDSPSVPLRGGGTWYDLAMFTDYVMFQPAVGNSIWVAIEQLPWTFSGTAEMAQGQWTLSSVQDPAKVISPIPAVGQPEWTGSILSGPFVSC